MKVRVRYFAALREQRGLGEETVETRAATLRDLYGELGLALPLKLVRFALRGQFVDPETPVAEGDEIALIPPVAGG